MTGLASGLDTKSIINALLEVERRPITNLTFQQEKVSDQAKALQSIQSSLLQLTYAASEFKLSALFEGIQTVSSSEPSRVGATITSGAGVGGYEVEVTRLANSAQRTFTFVPPAAEETFTIGGREYTLKAGAGAAELASKVNADGQGKVYAAVLNKETIVFSSRATGAGSLESVTASSSGPALAEHEGTAKEGTNAEYSVDGVTGTSTSNVLTGAIPGVTLTLASLTTKSGPVTIAVQPPAANAKAIEGQLQAFVTLYNSTVEAIQKQIAERPPVNPTSLTELTSGTLFGDLDLSNVLSQIRRTMYEPIAGLASEMSSPLNVGISTGAAVGSGTSTPGSLAGALKLDPAKLEAAVHANPEGVKLMLQQWSTNLNKVVNAVAEPGATLEVRINGDTARVREMKERIATMNEMLALRQKALEQTYARLEAVISRNSATGSWLSEQAAQLTANASVAKH